MASRTTALAVLCVALVATYLAGAEARSAAFGRSLHADLTCNDAKGLQGNCDALCECLGKQPEYAGRDPSECSGPCKACADATNSCAGDALPDPCKAYASDAAVQRCIGGGSSGR